MSAFYIVGLVLGAANVVYGVACKDRGNLGSCKYGAECGYVLDCECDCCCIDHPCECDEDLCDDGDNDEAEPPRGRDGQP